MKCHTFNSNRYTVKHPFGLAFHIPLRRRLGSGDNLISFNAKERNFVLGRIGKLQQCLSHGQGSQFTRFKRRMVVGNGPVSIWMLRRRIIWHVYEIYGASRRAVAPFLYGNDGWIVSWVIVLEVQFS